jgi:hypothetical protein
LLRLLPRRSTIAVWRLKRLEHAAAIAIPTPALDCDFAQLRFRHSDIVADSKFQHRFQHRSRQQIPTSLLTAFPTAISTSPPTALLFRHCSPQLSDNGADSASISVAIICPDFPESASIVVAIIRPDVLAYTHPDRHPDVSDTSHAIGDASIHADIDANKATVVCAVPVPTSVPTSMPTMFPTLNPPCARLRLRLQAMNCCRCDSSLHTLLLP